MVGCPNSALQPRSETHSQYMPYRPSRGVYFSRPQRFPLGGFRTPENETE